MTAADLKTLFEPKSVVIVGTSEVAEADKIYSYLFRHLVQNLSSYKKGSVQIVDLGGKIEGSQKSIGKIRKGQDLGIVLLPKKTLYNNVQKLLKRQVKALVLVKGDLEEGQIAELAAAARRKKMALLGPGSIGAINAANGLIAIPERVRIQKGRVAFVSQDCCVAYSIIDQAQAAGVSKLVSISDRVGTDESELLDYLVQDKETKAICLYIKRVRDGRKLVRAIRGAVAEKPVIILSGSAERAQIFEAAARQAGALLAHDVQDSINGAGGMVKQPPLHGPRVAVVTNLPGQAALLERYLQEAGLALAVPSHDTSQKIAKKLPGAKIPSFIDVGPAAKGEECRNAVELLLPDGNVDGVMVISALKSTLFGPEDLRRVADAAKKSREKPVIAAVLCAEDSPAIKEIMSTTELPVYSQLEEAVHVLNLLRSRGKQLERLKDPGA